MHEQLGLSTEQPDVQEVFNYWAGTMQKRKPLLGPARRARLTWSIKHYGVEACKQAIDGCKLDRYAMGHNKTKRKHNDILDIFRNEKSIEEYIERAEEINDEDW